MADLTKRNLYCDVFGLNKLLISAHLRRSVTLLISTLSLRAAPREKMRVECVKLI